MVEEEPNVAEEIQQEVVQPDQEETSHSQALQESTEESDKDRNFRELRESKKQLEREMRQMREQLEQISRSRESEPEEPDLSDDDLVEGKHLKRYIQRLENKIAQKEAASIPERLQGKFADFNQVVTPENVEKLKLAEPELYTSIVSGSDLYAKGVSAYKALKTFGIVKSDPYVADKERVQKTHNRPVSAQAVKGQGPLAEANAFANGLTPELRKQLYEEMVEAARGQS